jgi:hypothetical protein
MRQYSRWLSVLVLLLASVPALTQDRTPKLIDVHIHYDGEPGILEKLLAKLDAADGLGLLLTTPAGFPQASKFIHEHPDRFIGFGDIKLDDPNALQEYHMILLFHTGIVNRLHPEQPADISFDRSRVTRLDLIARHWPKLTVIGAHLGNPDYADAGEIGRWDPNLYFDMSGTTLIKKKDDYGFFRSIFWWTGVASPHTPASGADAFEKLVFGSDVFGGDVQEFDLALARYHAMLDACQVPHSAQTMIFSGTMWRILRAQEAQMMTSAKDTRNGKQ